MKKDDSPKPVEKLLELLPGLQRRRRVERLPGKGDFVARVALARVALVALITLGGLCACASQSQRRREQTDLQQLQKSLPGSYDSSAHGDGAPAQSVSFSIQPLRAQQIGDVVYFVRETPSDNAQLVLAQRIWTLALDAQGHLVQRVYLLKDPRRWVGAASDPDVLLSMLPEDLQELSGCELRWQHLGTAFEASGLPQSCHPGSAQQGLWIAQQARLSGRQLTLTERRVGADGALDAGEPPQSLTLLRGSSTPP